MARPGMLIATPPKNLKIRFVDLKVKFAILNSMQLAKSVISN